MMVLARAVIWVSSLAVPRVARRDFRDLWLGELLALAESGDPTVRQPGPLRFALGSSRHALVERFDDWRLGGTWRDAAQACRGLTREPGFALAVIGVIATAVGANAAIFSVVNATLLRTPPAVAGAERLVQVGRAKDNGGFDNVSFPAFQDLRAEGGPFEGLVAFSSERFLIDDGSGPRLVGGQVVSASYFTVLGARLPLGRDFTLDEERGSGAVAVISDAMWRRRFNSDPRVIGRSLSLNGSRVEIVGVAPPRFVGALIGTAPPEVWVPVSFAGTDAADRLSSRFNSWIWAVGRLRPGITVEQSRDMLAPIHSSIERQFPGTLGAALAVVPGVGLRPEDRALATRVSGLLMASVALVLLIACANVASLLLARGLARRNDVAIRLAIGASRFRIVRGAVVEAVVLALIAAGVAAVATTWTAAGVRWLMPYDLAIGFEPDATVFAFTFASAAGAGILVGLFPGIGAARTSVTAVIREDGGGCRVRRVRALLLVAQLALSFVLLAGTAVLTRSLVLASRVDPGFRPDGLTAATLDFRSARWTDAGVQAFVNAARERVSAAHVSSQVAFVRRLPIADAQPRTSVIVGEIPAGARPPVATSMAVDANYFTTMETPIVAGRPFLATDNAQGERVAIVSRSLARQLWGDADPVGRDFRGGAGRVKVIGVAADAASRSLRDVREPTLYVPLAQQRAGEVTIVARAAASPSEVADLLRHVASELAPGVPLVRLAPVRTLMGSAMGEARLTAILLALYGGAAMLLALVGVYALLVQSARERRKELGIRLALGADPSVLRRSVMVQGMRLAASAVLLGVALWAAAAPAIAHLLYDTAPVDPFSMAVVLSVFIAVAALAALGPARRAARTDPISSLRVN